MSDKSTYMRQRADGRSDGRRTAPVDSAWTYDADGTFQIDASRDVSPYAAKGRSARKKADRSRNVNAHAWGPARTPDPTDTIPRSYPTRTPDIRDIRPDTDSRTASDMRGTPDTRGTSDIRLTSDARMTADIRPAARTYPPIDTRIPGNRETLGTDISDVYTAPPAILSDAKPGDAKPAARGRRPRPAQSSETGALPRTSPSMTAGIPGVLTKETSYKGPVTQIPSALLREAVSTDQAGASRRPDLHVVSNDPDELLHYARVQQSSDERRYQMRDVYREQLQAVLDAQEREAAAASATPAAAAPHVLLDDKPPAYRRSSRDTSSAYAAADAGTHEYRSHAPEAASASRAQGVSSAEQHEAPEYSQKRAANTSSYSNRPVARPSKEERREQRKKEKKPERGWRALAVTGTLACSVLLAVLMLYFPAQDLYLTMRANERLADELDRNLERNARMEKRVASLRSPEGIQDEANRIFGLTNPDEYAVSVVGIEPDASNLAIPPQVMLGSGENTHTWMTDALDEIFGVDSLGTTATSSDVAQVTEGSGEDTSHMVPATNPEADIVAQGD